MLVLREAGQVVVGEDVFRAALRARGVVQHRVQLAPMNAEFGKGVAGELAARLAVNELPVAVEKRALLVFHRNGAQRVLQPERREFAHAVGE